MDPDEELKHGSLCQAPDWVNRIQAEKHLRSSRRATTDGRRRRYKLGRHRGFDTFSRRQKMDDVTVVVR